MRLKPPVRMTRIQEERFDKESEQFVPVQRLAVADDGSTMTAVSVEGKEYPIKGGVVDVPESAAKRLMKEGWRPVAPSQSEESVAGAPAASGGDGVEPGGPGASGAGPAQGQSGSNRGGNQGAGSGASRGGSGNQR